MEDGGEVTGRAGRWAADGQADGKRKRRAEEEEEEEGQR